ncbi:MAG: metallophosphatase family protein [Bacteroidales bacterium]|nr:metallophosphatase family protein [Bacteroidales bacterium]
MKRIGVISDTHGVLPKEYSIFFKDCDEIWHAGDVGSTDVLLELQQLALLRVVWGNIDGADIRAQSSEEHFFELFNQRIYIRHIVRTFSKYDNKILERLKQLKPTIVIAGHSHILEIKYDQQNKWLYINPGAAGKFGPHLKRTMVRFLLNENGVSDLEIWEKEKL